jgi:hypothetical protein
MADEEPDVVADEPTTEEAGEVEIEMSVLDALKEVCDLTNKLIKL